MPISIPRYTRVFLISTVALFSLSIGLALGLGLDMPPGLTTILAAMIAADREGRALARDTGRLLEGSEALKATLAMTAIAFVFTAVLYIVQLAIPGVASALTDISRGFFYALVGFLGLVVLLTNRIFLHNGMKTELSRQATKD